MPDLCSPPLKYILTFLPSRGNNNNFHAVDQQNHHLVSDYFSWVV